MPVVSAVIAAGAAAGITTAGLTAATAVAGVGIAGASALSQYKEGKRQAKSAAEANSEAMKQAKAKAANLKEASAKRSTMFDGNENNSQKSLLTAQKKKRRAISGAAGTRLTGGKLGSPATAGGATLLGQ